MTLYAVEALDDAIEATKSFLWPFDAGRWLRLAVVVFFVGGAAGGLPGGGGNLPFDGGEVPGGFPTDPGATPDLPALGDVLPIVVAVVALLVLLALVFGFLGSVMEFVLVTSLRKEEVHVRRYFGDHLGAGLRLFGFRLAVGLFGVVLFAGPMLAAFLATGGFEGGGPGAAFGLLLVLAPLFFLFGVLSALLYGFTTFFVVPVMLVEERGVLSSWRRLLPVVRAEWREFAVFVLLTAVLTVVAGTAVGFVVGLVALVLVGPVVVAGIAGAVTGSVAVLAAVGLLGLLVLLVVAFVAAAVRVPVVTYFRYYAMLLLGDAESDLDAIPGRRERIRAAGAGGSGGEAGSGDRPEDGGTGVDSA